ncbi:MAG: Rieske 2Fe-2S domain-containing protein [Candidatus Omnitrophica bacterium]|nr:Rieske 2Fe-2S domain-containing protein [Candidatus Omnitrophota bacterium]
MAEFVKVAKISDIPKETGMLVRAKGRRIALFRRGDQVHAIDAVCYHMGGPLNEGGLEGDHVTCPWHGWEFNVVTGEASFDKSIRQRVFEVKLEGDEVYVSLE